MGAQVRVIDTVPIFAPRGYQDAIDVRRASAASSACRTGSTSSEAGAELLAETVLDRVGQDFVY